MTSDDCRALLELHDSLVEPANCRFASRSSAIRKPGRENIDQLPKVTRNFCAPAAVM